MEEFVSHPAATSKAHTFTTIKVTQLQCGYANQTSSNQTHELSTHGSSRHCQATATPLRSTTLHSPQLTQLPIPLPSDLAQNHWAFIPHEVFNQLSNALQHLTCSMHALWTNGRKN